MCKKENRGIAVLEELVAKTKSKTLFAAIRGNNLAEVIRLAEKDEKDPASFIVKIDDNPGIIEALVRNKRVAARKAAESEEIGIQVFPATMVKVKVQIIEEIKIG